MRHSDSVALGVEADIARTPKNRSLVTRLRHRLGFDFDPTMLCTGSMNITLHGADAKAISDTFNAFVIWIDHLRVLDV
jgi:hypothetical protein